MSTYKGAVAKTVTIAASGTTSAPIHVRERMVVGVITPAALTSVAMTFEASDREDGTYVPVHDAGGTAVSVTVAPSRATAVTGEKADALLAWSFIKIVMGSSEAAEREIIVLMK